MKDLQLAGALFLGLMLGYLLGVNKHTDPSIILPSNYDPNRALCMDAVKAQQQNTEACWKQVVTLLQERIPKKAGR